MKIAIIINSHRLTPELKATLEDTNLTEKYDIQYDLFTPEPDKLEATLKQLNHEAYNACLVGGGDGTVRTAAQILQSSQLPLVILPLGTFNVLAKSLNYPNDIDALFSMIKNKKTKEIDLAEVNKVIFANHAWLGFYYYIMRMREKHKNILGRSRLLKALFNAFLMFKHMPIYEFKIKVDHEVRVYKTCLIFVSNNESTSQLFDFGKRPLLATGLLYVNILNCHTRLQLFLCMFSIIFTSFKESKYVEQFSVEDLDISSSNKQINIVVDGEMVKLESPLHFINHKNKLLVIAA